MDLVVLQGFLGLALLVVPGAAVLCRVSGRRPA